MNTEVKVYSTVRGQKTLVKAELEINSEHFDSAKRLAKEGEFTYEFWQDGKMTDSFTFDTPTLI